MKKKRLTVLSALFAALLINCGLDKFFRYVPVPPDLAPELLHDFGALAESSWLMPVIALSEIIGGALIVFPVMVGVLLTHIFVDSSRIVIAIVSRQYCFR